MLLLPIVDRELRVAARNWRIYLQRVMTGVVGMGMVLYLAWMARYAMGGGMAGMFILKSSSYMAWAVVLFGGVMRTCDTISSEKRGDTLGLLFLTHLRGRDVVFGKLVAGSLGAFYGLLALAPILSIPVLMGGVSAGEMVRIPVSLLNSLLLAVTAGLLVSAVVRNQRAASSISGGVLVFLAVFLPLISQAVERELHWTKIAAVLLLPSPLYAHEMAFSSAFGLSTNWFWTAIAVQTTISVAGLIATCVIVPRTWQTPAGRALLWRDRMAVWTYGNPTRRAARRARLLARNAFLWLLYRDRFAALWPILFLFFTLGVVLWCSWYYELPVQPACGLLLGVVAINELVVRMRVASIAATRLAEDRQSGALEMILATPIQLKEIVSGVWAAVRRIYLPAYCCLFAIYVLVSSIFAFAMDADSDAALVFIFFAVVSIGDFVVLGYVAMWKALRVSSARHAAGSALVRVLIVPWVCWLFMLPVINEVEPLRKFFDGGEPYTYLLAGFATWATSSFTAMLSARRNLARYFREAATDRYVFEGKVGLLARVRRLAERLGAVPGRVTSMGAATVREQSSAG